MRATAAVLLVVAAAAAGCGGASHPAAGTTPAATASTAPTCTNAVISAAARAAIAIADGRPAATELAGSTFYGTCGGTAYAVSRFVPGTGATEQEEVAFQDDGAFPELFADPGSGWRKLSVGDRDDACPASSTLPSALRAIWHDCSSTATIPPASASPTTCAERAAQTVLVRVTSVAVAADGSAVLTGTPVSIHCGGADDFQFVDGTGTTTVHLLAGGTVERVTADGDPAPLAVRELGTYVAHDPASGVFAVTGGTGRATDVAEQFHP